MMYEPFSSLEYLERPEVEEYEPSDENEEVFEDDEIDEF